MSERPVRLPDDADRFGDAAFRLVVIMAAILVALAGLRIVSDALPSGDNTGLGQLPGGSRMASEAPATETADVTDFLLTDVRPAPALDLGGAGGAASVIGSGDGLVLVFFGYTHCPDVCPATIGTVGLAIDAYGPGARAILVSIDPERDTPTWLEEFVRYLPAGFSAVSGSANDTQRTADAWGVRYAKVDGDHPNAYTMSHTADVFVVDDAGMIRARFPFGTDASTMTAVLRAIRPPDRAAAPTAAPTAPPTASPATVAPTSRPVHDLAPMLVSSAVWAGPTTPVIFTLDEPALDEDGAATVFVQVESAAGAPVGPAVSASRVQPEGVGQVSFVAEIAIPEPGAWTLSVAATDGAGDHRGALPLTALDPGGTAALGTAAPRAATRTPADVGGDLTWLTTDPLPDRRLSATSTTEALAAGRPFVLVVDSIAFRVTPQCGQAVVMAKRLVDRWAGIPFIHHEPYRYEVVTTEPVIEGSLENPRLTDVADAWGVGSEPWGVASMPWLFVVDREGVVRAKYQGVIGSADVDVMLTLLTGGSSGG